MRNILNIDALDRFLAELAELAQNDLIALWVKAVARRWIINHHPTVLEVTRADLDPLVLFRFEGALVRAWPLEPSPQLPAWAVTALGRGDTLHELILTEELFADLALIIDFFSARQTQALLRTAQRVSYPDALSHARRWLTRVQHEQMRRAIDQDLNVVHEFDNGFRIVHVLGAEALNIEGMRMQHCVGSYADLVEMGGCDIFSLRDESNRPHATIELVGREVTQIKGRANGPVRPAYRWMVRAFLAWLDVEVAYDGRNIDWVDLPAAAQLLLREAADINTMILSDTWIHMQGVRDLGDWVFASPRQMLRLEPFLAHVEASRAHLSDPARAHLAQRLLAGDGRLATAQTMVLLDIFGQGVEVAEILGPLPYLRLAESGVLGHGVGPAISRLADLALNDVLTLAAGDPDRLLYLGLGGPGALSSASGTQEDPDLGDPQGHAPRPRRAGPRPGEDRAPRMSSLLAASRVDLSRFAAARREALAQRIRPAKDAGLRLLAGEGLPPQVRRRWSRDYELLRNLLDRPNPGLL